MHEVRLLISGVLILMLFSTSHAKYVAAAGRQTKEPFNHATVQHNILPVSTRSDAISVRIFDRMRARTIHVGDTGSGLIVYTGESDLPLFLFRPGKTVDLTIVGKDVRLRSDKNEVLSAQIRIAALNGEALSVRIAQKAAARRYHGELEVRVRSDRSGLSIVNRVPMEAYVASVIGSEYGLNDVEGAKAMAVAARTYALNMMQKRPEFPRLVDDDRSQVYGGATSATAHTWRATHATAGEVLTFSGKPIEAVYSSSNGGHSANNESIWTRSTPYPYLRGRKDPYDSISPDASWHVEIKQRTLHDELTRYFGLQVKDLHFDRSKSDRRILKVTLVARNGKNRTITGSRFRSVVTSFHGMKGLKSTYFTVEKKGGKYQFDGHGYGHGVGLSQWGAHGMALQGKEYREILSYYYPGTRLDQLYSAPTDIFERLSDSALASASLDPPLSNVLDREALDTSFATESARDHGRPESSAIEHSSRSERTFLAGWGRYPSANTRSKDSPRGGWIRFDSTSSLPAKRRLGW